MKFSIIYVYNIDLFILVGVDFFQVAIFCYLDP